MYVPIKYKTRVRTFVIVVLRNKNEKSDKYKAIVNDIYI